MNKKLVTFVAVASLAVSGFAFAATATKYKAPMAQPSTIGAWYAGIGINHNATTSNHFTYDSQNYKQNRSNAGFDLFVGKRLSQYVAGEFGYNYIGNQKYTTTSGANGSIELTRTQMVYLDGYGFWPVMGGLEVYGKLGPSFYHLNPQYKGAAQNIGGTNKANTFALNTGIGVQYNIQQFGVRAGWTHVIPVAGSSSSITVDDMPDTIALDVLYHFA